MDPGIVYVRCDWADMKLRWTWRDRRLAAHPKVVDLRVAGWILSLAVPKSGEPVGGGVVPKLGGPAVVEPSWTEPCKRLEWKIKLAEYVSLIGRRQKDKQLQVPITKTVVRTSLGLTGYYRKFIPGYAELAALLTDLMRKNAPNEVWWTEECDGAFKRLKQCLCCKPILRCPNFSLPFMLQMDASAA